MDAFELGYWSVLIAGYFLIVVPLLLLFIAVGWALFKKAGQVGWSLKDDSTSLIHSKLNMAATPGNPS
ncbi:MAG: hypothetical protein O2818_09580 [Bacteroidetes bacterium]|nr:hypothetical protein [Bacteroidota bacterium]